MTALYPKYLRVLIACCLLPVAHCLSQGTWTQKADFISERRLSVAFSINGTGYVGTGMEYILKQDFWEYNPSADSWTQKANFPDTTRQSAAGFSIGNKGYVGLGWNCQLLNDFWEYDPVLNAWSKKANFPGIVRGSAVSFSIGAKGYIGSGWIPNSAVIDFWEYDQLTDAWTQKSDLPGVLRNHAFGFSIGLKGYIGGGGLDSVNCIRKYYSDFWEYDVISNVWTQKADFLGALRHNAYSFSNGTNAYVGLGLFIDSVCNFVFRSDFWEYNPSINSWTQKTSFPGVSRIFAFSFSIGVKGILGTGWDGSLPYRKDVWEFDPNGNGINELQNQISISISPNPFSSQTTFTLSDPAQKATLKLFSISGEEVRELQVKGYKFQVERGDLKSGVYFYQLISETKTIATGKLIIQ